MKKGKQGKKGSPGKENILFTLEMNQHTIDRLIAAWHRHTDNNKRYSDCENNSDCPLHRFFASLEKSKTQKTTGFMI